MYYTDREVREILEQVYAEAYDQGIDDTLDYIDENYELEDDSFDLMDEYDTYTESSKNVRNQMDRLSQRTDSDGNKYYYSDNPKRDWTKFSAKRVINKKSGYVSGSTRPVNDVNAIFGYKRTYVVNNNDPDEKRRPKTRGRIKSTGYSKSDDPRSETLKEKVKANASKREAEKKAKLRPFKNKGNRYEDED